MNTCKSSALGRAGTWLTMAALIAACGESDAEIPPPGSGGSTGATGGSSGSGGSGTGAGTGGPTTGGAGTGGGGPGAGGSAGTGTAGTGGTLGGDSGVPPGDAGGCPSYANFALGIKIVMNVTWMGSIATNPGMEKVVLWNLAKLSANGTVLAGDAASCGTVLPDIILTAVGAGAAGGEKVNIEIPFASWDAPSIPRFAQQGTLSGWNPGSAIEMEPTIALVGLTMADPLNAPWPAAYTAITGADAEGDGKLGITGVPKNGMGYVNPPTSLGLFGSAPAAKQVYIASRTVVQLSGKTTTCEEQAGSANVKYFDNHVIGCYTTLNAECDANQIKFIDESRSVYVPVAGMSTFVGKKMPDTATCADVRAALPL